MKILLVDDHPLFLDGLKNLLTSRGVHVVGCARDGLEALDKARTLRPEVILLDIHMPQLDGLAALRLIKTELPEIKIVMLTMSAEDEDLFEAIKSGACGYLLKTQDTDEFFVLLQDVARGEVALSPDGRFLAFVANTNLPAASTYVCRWDAQAATNLVGAFQYADTNWPWMGAMFVFNLDFNQNPALSECEQMRYYSIKGKPAESALATMSKNKASLTGQLKTGTSLLSILIDVNEPPITWTSSVGLGNAGWQPLVYTATVDGSASVVPGLSGATTGTLSTTQESLLQMSVAGFSRTLGTYTGTLTVSWYAAGVGNRSKSIDLRMIVVSDVQRVWLPLITR